jgi:hypothetical protein
MTAVEWVVDKMMTEHHSKTEWDEIFEQAKKMDKNQRQHAIEFGIQSILQAVPGVTSTRSVLDDYFKQLNSPENPDSSSIK